MFLKNSVSYQLNAFKKFITDVLGIQNVEYSSHGQVIQRNFNKPWVQLEITKAYREDYTEETEDNTDTLRFKTVTVHRVLINVHCRFRSNEEFQTLEQAIGLQSILYHNEATKPLHSFEISVVEPSEEIETLPSIEFDSIEFDDRLEPDTWFPVVLQLGNQVDSPLLDVGWFNTVLLTTNIHDIDSSLQLDDERIPE